MEYLNLCKVCKNCSVGVVTVLVALMAQKAEIKYDPAYIMPTQIANKITSFGYPATVLESDTNNNSTIEVRVIILCGYSLLFKWVVWVVSCVL